MAAARTDGIPNWKMFRILKNIAWDLEYMFHGTKDWNAVLGYDFSVLYDRSEYLTNLSSGNEMYLKLTDSPSEILRIVQAVNFYIPFERSISGLTNDTDAFGTDKDNLFLVLI